VFVKAQLSTSVWPAMETSSYGANHQEATTFVQNPAKLRKNSTLGKMLFLMLQKDPQEDFFFIGKTE